MANRKITDFANLAGAQTPTMIMPVVDPALGAVAAANLKSTLNDLFADLGINTSDGASGLTGLLAAPAVSAATKVKFYYHRGIGQFLFSRSAGAYYAFAPMDSAAPMVAGNLPYVATGGVLAATSAPGATINSAGEIGAPTFTAIQATAATQQDLYIVKNAANTFVWSFEIQTNDNISVYDAVNNKIVTTWAAGSVPYLQMLATAGINFAGIGTVGATSMGLAKNSTTTIEINSGQTIAAGGSARDLLLRNLKAGIASSLTGTLVLANSGSAFTTTLQAGVNVTASRTYTWPTDFGVAGSILTDAAGDGTLSWSSAAGITGSIAATQIAFGSGANAIAGSATFTFTVGTGALAVAVVNGQGSALVLDATNGVQMPVGMYTGSGTKLGVGWTSGLIGMPVAGVIGWSSSSDGRAAADSSFSRISAGVIGVGTGATGSVAGGLQAAYTLVGAGLSGTPSVRIDSASHGFSRGASQGLNAVITTVSGTDVFAIPQAGAGVVSTTGYLFSTAISASADLGLYRNAAGVLEINNGTLGAYRDLIARKLYVTNGTTYDMGLQFQYSANTNYYHYIGTSYSATSTSDALGFYINNGTVSTTNQVLLLRGDRRVGVNQGAPAAALHVNTANSTDVGLILQGAASQSANLQEWQDSTGAIIAKINATGGFTATTNIVVGSAVLNASNLTLTNSILTAGSSVGVFILYNSSQTDFNRLSFGGTTSSFPSLKRNTTYLEARLADDSAYTDLVAKYGRFGGVSASGVVTAGGASTGGAYVAAYTSSQVANDAAFLGTFGGSAITGLLYGVTIAGSATQGIFNTLLNSENATSTAHCSSRFTVGGASAGDPFIRFSVSGVTDWSFGIRNSDSDKFYLNASSDLSTANIFAVTVAGVWTWADAINQAFSTGTGSQIGTAAAQKIGHWGVTPVVQPATTGTTTGFTAGAGTAVKDDSTFTGGVGSKAYTIGDIVLALKQGGFMAAS